MCCKQSKGGTENETLPSCSGAMSTQLEALVLLGSWVELGWENIFQKNPKMH